MLPNTVKRAVILKLELVNTQVFHLTNALNQKNQQPLKTICWYVTNQFLLKTLTLFRMGFFGAAHGWSSPPRQKKICHTYPTTMKLGTVIPVIPYLKTIQKIYESRDTPPEFRWHQQFFTRNQEILLHQEIHVYIAFWYKTSNSFNFSWVYKDCFNKKSCNFGDVSKIGYPRPS